MSSIAFHSPSETIRISGRERAYASLLTLDMTVAAISPTFKDCWITGFLEPGNHLLRTETDEGPFERSFRLWLGYSRGESLVHPDGRKLDPFDFVLNTAYRMGSDAVKLLTRLHGQCELHCYVEGPDRAWLAGIIARGRKQGVLRKPFAYDGWDALANMLLRRDDESVVCSYSVCESFPNQGVADWDPPAVMDVDGFEDLDYDAWYDLSSEEQWDLATSGLRARDEGYTYTGRICPATWDDYVFGHGVSAFDLMELVDDA